VRIFIPAIDMEPKVQLSIVLNGGNLSIGGCNLTPVEIRIEDTQFGLGPLSLEFLKSKITAERLRHS
jgi:hypothetical protein